MIEFFKLIKTSVAGAKRTILAQVRGDASDENDDDAEPYDDAEVIQPIGLVSRPTITSKTEAIIVRDGDEIHVIAVVDKGGPVHECEEGETQLYGTKEPTCRIRLRANGDIEITAKSGQNVVVNGGSAKVAREGDAVNASAAMTTWMGQVASATFTTAPAGAIGAVAAGADHFKA